MREIFGYIRDYFLYVNKKILILCSLQSAILIYLNYQHKLESWLTTRESLAWPAFTGHYILFATAFILPYLFYTVAKATNFFVSKSFVILLILSPAIFSLKMALNTETPFSNNVYW